MRAKFEVPVSIWPILLHLFSCHLKTTTSSFNCDKTFTYYEEYGQNSFNVTCNGLTKGYEHILENITINNEISLTITNSVLENLTPDIFRNVRNIKILNILNSTFDFNRNLPIFNKLEKLEDLAIQDTNFDVGNVTLKGLSSLKTLVLSNNSLSSIELGALTDLIHLEKLEIIDNHIKNISEVPLCELQKLKTLALRNNLLSNLNLFIFLCSRNSKTLDFNINDGPALPSIHQDYFMNLTSFSYDLVNLDLSYNQIFDVGFSLEGLSKLRVLNLSYNKLFGIKYVHFKTLYRLEKLLLSNNEILAFESRVFDNKTRLNYLDLSHNRLKEIIVSKLSKLQILDLSYNNLTSVLLKNLTSLQKVNLEHNTLENLESKAFVKLPKLISLNLGGNKLILSLGLFKNMQGLRTLQLGNNSLRIIPEKAFLDLKNLRKLDLSNNELVTLDVNVFHDLESLEVLNLSCNSIESLSYLALEPLKNLRSLDVANNKIQFIEYDIILLKLPDLTNFNIKANFLSCESLSKIILFLKQRHIAYTNSEKMDMANVNQNVAGIPCRSSKSIAFAIESKRSSTMLNLGIGLTVVLVGILTGIVTYKFYIYLKRRKYRADEFELIDE